MCCGFSFTRIGFFILVVDCEGKAKFMMFVLLGLFIPMVNTFYVVIGIVDIFSDLREIYCIIDIAMIKGGMNNGKKDSSS